MKRTSGAAFAGSRWAAAAVVAAAVVLRAGPVIAQPTPAKAPAAAKRPTGPIEVQGTVLALDKDELIVDLGSAAGATENLVVELWRPLKLKHPVTGKIVADRFKIGQIQISQVRAAMSLAKPVGTLSRDAAPGDIVIFTPAAPASTGPLAASTATPAPASTGTLEAQAYEDRPAAAAPIAPLDLDAKNVTEMFEALRGQSVSTRVARYEDFVRAYPQSRFSAVLSEEARALKRFVLLPAAAASSARPPSFVVSLPGRIDAVPGLPLRIAVELTPAISGAVLQLRRTGETFYTPVPMTPAGQGYFAAVVPPERVAARNLEYFIEGQNEGRNVSLVGTPSAPETIHVAPDPKVKPPPRGFDSVSVLTDFADYNRLALNDFVWQTEGTFGVRYGDLGIRAVRMGFGVYRGVSGTVRELDELGKTGRSVGLTYGYVEGEFGIHKYFSLINRLAVGLLDDGVGAGGQLFARIGNDQKTNLLLGGEFLGGIGLRSIIELQLNTFERFPILLRMEVTNQPAGAAPAPSQPGAAPAPSQLIGSVAEGQSDIAGRGIVQLGFRFTPDLTVALRGSFQGRNINHAGPGVGGSVGYTW
jgi:hypothetical protein